VKEHPLPAFGLLPSQEVVSHFPDTIPGKAFKDYFPPGTKMDMVNSLKGGPILHRRVEICTEGWN